MRDIKFVNGKIDCEYIYEKVKTKEISFKKLVSINNYPV